MATYDPSYSGAHQFQGHSDARLERPLRVSWSGIVGGTALGWGVFSLLTLIGAAIGFARFDPYSAHPGNGLDVGSGVFGTVALLVTSFLGAFFALRIAGDRRRTEALMHGGICWALSMLLGGLLALGAAQTAAHSAATVASGPRAQAKLQRESNLRENRGGPTALDRDRAADAADAAAKTSGAAAGGAFLALIASLFGALVGASRSSGKSLSEELHLGRRHPRQTPAPRPPEPSPALRRDEILRPPT
ncbi:MAG: hypothetical protein NVSMB23_12690 [Myxococcales bacterium]